MKLFCSDLDGTIYGDLAATDRFREFWTELPKSERPWLCYVSGRLIDDQVALIHESPLPKPDFLIGGVGTCILDFSSGSPLHDYEAQFKEGWDLERVRRIVAEFPGIEAQPERFQTDLKSSWYWYDASPEDVEQLRRRLTEAGLNVAVIYSSSRDLDVLPAQAGKGNAVTWLCRHLSIDPAKAVVAGDTGNDLRMFQVPGIFGIIVANAKPELGDVVGGSNLFWASLPEADGVIEGLRYFGVGS